MWVACVCFLLPSWGTSIVKVMTGITKLRGKNINFKLWPLEASECLVIERETFALQINYRFWWVANLNSDAEIVDYMYVPVHFFHLNVSFSLLWNTTLRFRKVETWRKSGTDWSYWRSVLDQSYRETLGVNVIQNQHGVGKLFFI